MTHQSYTKYEDFSILRDSLAECCRSPETALEDIPLKSNMCVESFSEIVEGPLKKLEPPWNKGAYAVLLMCYNVS